MGKGMPLKLRKNKLAQTDTRKLSPDELRRMERYAEAEGMTLEELMAKVARKSLKNL